MPFWYPWVRFAVTWARTKMLRPAGDVGRQQIPSGAVPLSTPKDYNTGGQADGLKVAAALADDAEKAETVMVPW